MEKKIKAFAAQYTMLPEKAKVLVAVSGGMDSMCLLHVLTAQGVSLAAALFNHQLRGEEADADERFVRDWCEQNGVAFYAGRADVAALAAKNGWTVEEAGRRARYEFLERTAERYGFDRIATAHHAQDNAETLLFNLLRGAGPGGLGGIAPVRGRLIRPMLCVTRDEIERYAVEYDVPYRTDSTNADLSYTRNYLRHEVLPLLQNVNAAAIEHLSNTALLMREEDAYLDALAREHLQEMQQTDDVISLPCAAVQDAPQALRARMMRLMLDALRVGKKDFTAAHIDDLVALTLGTGRAQLDLPHFVRATREKGVLTLTAGKRQTPSARTLSLGERITWGAYEITVQHEKTDGAFRVRFDASSDTLSVSAWNAREYLTLPGKTRRSLKRLFADAGISPAQRDAAPVIRMNGRAAAVYGIGTDQAFLPTDDEGAVTIEITKRI